MDWEGVGGLVAERAQSILCAFRTAAHTHAAATYTLSLVHGAGGDTSHARLLHRLGGCLCLAIH